MGSRGLRAGDFVLTGVTTSVILVDRPAVFVADFGARLGKVELEVTP